MLRRALERIIQLYTDKSHFVYELLQNAEDCGASKIKFFQYEDRLEVVHDGRPFSLNNLQGLCDIGKSDKINDLSVMKKGTSLWLQSWIISFRIVETRNSSGIVGTGSLYVSIIIM